MDEKKKGKKKVLHWVLLIGIACVLAFIVLTIIMFPVIKGEVYYTKEGRVTVQNDEKNGIDGPIFPDNMDHEPPSCILVDICNEDIFEKGYYEYYFEFFTDGVCYIGSTNEPESDIEWKVYISDVKLSEEEIYALEGTEPIAVNKGEADIERGQWIYILCNVNSKTSDTPSSSNFSIITYRGYA